MQFFKVPAPIFQQMANRLSELPYREVATMLNAITNIQAQDDDAPPAPPVDVEAAALRDGAREMLDTMNGAPRRPRRTASVQ